jgi:predicted small integral membrane protein
MTDFLAEHFAWMAWTWQTALFFGGIALCLVVLTILAVAKPETPHRGILGFSTTRGDRFFVSLILAAFIFLASVKLGAENPLYPSAAALLVAAVMFRFA